MAGTVRKLVVEVVEARDLLPKDGTGTSSPYVIADFDGQRRRTQTVHWSLNPAWNEALEFNVNGPVEATGEPLEIDVHHDRRVGPSRRNNFLGRVRLDCRQFVRKGEEALIYFPLEKKSLFGWVRGDIGLRIYYLDKHVEEPAPPPPPEEAAAAPPPDSAAAAPPPEPAKEAAAAVAEAEPARAEQISEPNLEPEPEPVQLEVPPEGEPNPEGPSESDPTPPENDDVPPPEPDPQSAEDSGAVPAAPPTEPPTVVPVAIRSPRPVTERSPETIERSSYDLVDKMQYLFIRIVRARSLPRAANPHIKVSAFGSHVSTREGRRAGFLEWNQTLAFARDQNYATGDSTMEVSVWDLPPDADVDTAGEKYFLGGVCFDVSEIPLRDPPDSPLATQWYRLESGVARGGDLMLATWIGTQADESFHEAWKAGAPANQASSRSTVHE